MSLSTTLATLATDLGRTNSYSVDEACNSAIINMIDGCAISLPIHPVGEPPVGRMLAGEAEAVRGMLDIGVAVKDLVGSGAPS